MRVVLPVPAGQGDVAAADPAREQRHALVPRGRAGELGDAETRGSRSVSISCGAIDAPSNAV